MTYAWAKSPGAPKRSRELAEEAEVDVHLLVGAGSRTAPTADEAVPHAVSDAAGEEDQPVRRYCLPAGPEGLVPGGLHVVDHEGDELRGLVGPVVDHVARGVRRGREGIEGVAHVEGPAAPATQEDDQQGDDHADDPGAADPAADAAARDPPAEAAAGAAAILDAGAASR